MTLGSLNRLKSTQWQHLAIVVGPEGARIESRGQLAAWLRANDLPTQARAVMTKRVLPGQVVVYAIADSKQFAGTGVHVVALRTLIETLTTKKEEHV
jgi:hypothetical protein